jgi:hypothetical protein
MICLLQIHNSERILGGSIAKKSNKKTVNSRKWDFGDGTCRISPPTLSGVLKHWLMMQQNTLSSNIALNLKIKNMSKRIWSFSKQLQKINPL